MKKRTLSLLLAVVCLFSLTAGVLSGCGGSKLQVSFDLNYDGAPAAPAAIEVKTGKTYGELPAVTVQREGYTFAGWCLDADGEEPVTAETTVTKETDHTLYAKWEGLEYTVSFDLQGGNINGITTVEPATVTVGNVYSMMAIPDDPQMDNHTFLGWYYDPEGTQGPVTASTKVVKTCDHTLYAKWKENQLLYDFEKIEDISAFNNRGNGLSFNVAAYGDSNQLMIQNPNEGKSDDFLVMWAELKAGTRVTMDVTFTGELTEDARMHLFCYGANIVGDPITTGVINKALSDTHRKWYDGNGCRAKQENGVWFYGDENDWQEGNTVTVDFVVMEDCSGLSLWVNLGSNMEPAQWAQNAIYIDNIQFTPGYQEITEADMGGVEQKPQEQTEGEENFPFTFECGSVDSDVFKLRDSNLNMSVVEQGGSQQLKLQLSTANGKNWLWLNKSLQAGTKVTFDVTFDNAGTGASMSIYGYGSKENGDPITVKPSGSNIDIQWYNGQGVSGSSGKKTVEINIYEACSGISLMLGFDGNPETVIYLDNFRLGKMSGSQQQTSGETNFPFTFECGSASSDVFKLRDSDLKMSVKSMAGSKQLVIQPTKADGKYWLWLNKDLKAGYKVTLDVTFDRGNTNGDMSIFAYGSKTSGDPITEGTPTDTIPQSWFWGQGVNADFSAGNTNKQTITITVYQPCSGISLMLKMASGTSVYIDNITLDTSGEIEYEPSEPTEPEATEPPAPGGEENFPFTFEVGTYSPDVLDARNSRLNMSVVDYDDSKQLKIGYISTNNWLWLHKELKAGSTVTFDVTFDNAGTGDAMSIFCYGSKANGDPVTEGTPTVTIPQTWFWGQGVNADFASGSTNTQTVSFTVYEDCYGISMMLGFGDTNKTQTAIYLDNIVLTQPGEEPPAETEPDETEPEATEPEATEPPAAGGETEFPFTFEDGTYSADIFDKRNSVLDLSVADYDGSKQLKISYISTNNWLWLRKELKAGSTVTFDVTFDDAGTGETMSIFCYGAKSNGDPISEGTGTDTIPQSWYWGQGVRVDYAESDTNTWTVTFVVYEDCYGVAMMLGFGDTDKTKTAIYLDNIVLEEEPTYGAYDKDTMIALLEQQQIDVDGVLNVRDVGGYYTEDGQYRVRTGLIIRGANPDSIKQAGIKTLIEDYQIKTQLDLRASDEASGSSPMGTSVNYVQISSVYYAEVFYPANYSTVASIFKLFASADNYPVYFHCAIGRDRTGTVALLLNALLGVSESDLRADYYLTFYTEEGAGEYAGETIVTMKDEVDALLNGLKAYDGETLAEKTENYLLEIGVTQAEIDAIRSIMLVHADAPAEVETKSPFTFACGSYSAEIFDQRNSNLEMSVEDYNGSKQLKLRYTDSSANNWLWLKQEMKAGTVVTMDVTFVNGGTDAGMSLYCYGSQANGDPITDGDVTESVPQSWYWGQGGQPTFNGVTSCKVSLTFTAYQDCNGISMMLGFGDSSNKTMTAIYLDNIVFTQPGEEPPAETEPDETEPEATEPEVTEPSAQTDFPFTFDDGVASEEIFKLRDSDLEMTVAEQGGSQQLKLQPTVANGKHWLWLNKELKAGTVITMDVTFQRKLGTMSLFLYGSQANGDPITEGTPTDTIPQTWFWGQGVNADFTSGNTNTQTITFTVYEDCYGISFMLGYGNKKPNVIYLDNIQITQQSTGEGTEPEETEPEETTPAAAETESPFTFEGGSFSADVFDKRNSELDMSVVDYDGSKQLKVSYISTNNWLWLHKELKAGTTVTFDVTFDNAGTGDAMSIFCYGSKANGDPVTEGTPTDTIPQAWFWGQGVSAEFDSDGKKKYTVTFTVYEDCCGMSMMIGFGDANKTSTAIYLDNIVITEP